MKKVELMVSNQDVKQAVSMSGDKTFWSRKGFSDYENNQCPHSLL